jgi:lipid-A-disaccharide synthase-like uncharacterized protein
VANELRPRAVGLVFVALVLVVLGARLFAQVREARAAAPTAEWNGEIDLQDRLKDVEVERTTAGDFVTLDTSSGDERITVQEFVDRLWRAQREVASHGWLYRVLNITTPFGMVWVTLGFAGQALFTWRMLLQWWASERLKRSVVPASFWWASLIGGLMLLVYFVWRKDVVGVVGQSTGAFVYARNLVLIHRASPTASA